MSRTHKPQRGDTVNDTRRVPNANGKIIRILYSDDGPEEILVRFDDKVEFYPYEDFDFTWTDRYGGAFILDKENLS